MHQSWKPSIEAMSGALEPDGLTLNQSSATFLLWTYSSTLLSLHLLSSRCHWNGDVPLGGEIDKNIYKARGSELGMQQVPNKHELLGLSSRSGSQPENMHHALRVQWHSLVCIERESYSVSLARYLFCDTSRSTTGLTPCAGGKAKG
jgi:hypothetical protein